MWETCSDHPLLWTKPPSKYPSELVGNGLISPIKLTYNILKEAIAKTHDSIVSNAWSADQAKHYLWVFGVNNDTIASLSDRCIMYPTTTANAFVSSKTLLMCPPFGGSGRGTCADNIMLCSTFIKSFFFPLLDSPLMHNHSRISLTVQVVYGLVGSLYSGPCCKVGNVEKNHQTKRANAR